MDEKDSWRLSWPTLFIVTALSFLLFNGMVKLLEGSFSLLLTRVSIITAIAGILTWLAGKISFRKKNRQAI